jgi:serine O-acetyltransferase
MMSDLAFALVRLLGGFWAFRTRMRAQRPRSPIQRVMQMIYYAYLNRYGAYIGHASRFAGEPCLPHGLYGIFIAGGARVGRNCVIFQQVTLGANAIPGSKGAGCPTVGDNVYIGVGAKIIGNVHVGDNSRIGANCVVTADVPANALVVLPHPRVIARDEPQNNRYYRWRPGAPEYFDSGRWVTETDPAIIEGLKNAF